MSDDLATSASGLERKRVLLIVGGGVSAYKSLDLIRRLRERGTSVRVILTAAAREFVTPLTAAALSGEAIFEDLFSLTDEAQMGHIELSRDADLLVVAPATADLLAKMAAGLANDLASTALLATDKKILAAPAMNLRMWLHPSTTRNVARLVGDGVLFVGPNDGEMACGEFGPGRMAEPMEIVEAIGLALSSSTTLPLPSGVGGVDGLLAGRHVLVTSGPTQEPIDPVRFIANRSSGRQGHAIAQAAADAGARVTLVSGPVAISDPRGVSVIRVETAAQMLAAVESALPADIFIAAAAVADWRVESSGPNKIKKGAGGAPTLRLVENPDILATIAVRTLDRPKIVVGFAAETDSVVQNARAKLAAKNCDLIVANDVSEASGVFGGADNEVHFIADSGVESLPRMDKRAVAARLIMRLAKYSDIS
jgi:phosphopantothenoylcysteine decarboxylase/phosphopantothenate--cysteine ligase